MRHRSTTAPRPPRPAARARFRPRLALAGAGLVVAVGCGARSQLESPTSAGGAGGSGGSGGSGGTLGCVDGTVTLTKAKPTVMFVIDRSGSMGGHLGQMGGNQSRWAILTKALATTLPPVDQTMAVGALLFPTPDGSHAGMTCALPGQADLVPATGNVAAMVSLLSTTTPGGGTPTAGALQVAATALFGVHAATSARALVLATDGGPNCNPDLDPSTCTCVQQGCQNGGMCLDDARTVSQITTLHTAGLPTYVIGIQNPGDTQFTSVLDAMAIAGGRPKVGGAQDYYQASSATELTDAFSAIRDQLGNCTYLASSVPDAGGTIVVKLGDVVIPYDPTEANGWAWANEANGEIVLVGAACTTVAAASGVSPVAEVQCAEADGGTEAGTDGGTGGGG